MIAKGLFDVTAYPTMDDIANMVRGDVVFESQRFPSNTATAIPSANLTNLSRGKNLVALSPFLRHINSVALLGAEKQMFGPNARRVIAAVKNASVGRDRTVVKFPRESVCKGAGYNSVSKHGSSRVPNPTRAKFRSDDRAILIDAPPKTLVNRRIAVSPSTKVTAKPTLPLRKATSVKLGLALLASVLEKCAIRASWFIIRSGHDLILLNAVIKLWSGSLGGYTPCGPFVF
jgi:hypothetical protein